MYMRSRSSSRSSSSHPRYVRGQGTHSMSDSPYYDQFPEERKKLKRKVVKKSAKKTMKKRNLKPCPASKVRNPKTNRCINKTGRLAKTLKKKGKL